MKRIHVVSPYESAAMIRMSSPLVEHLKNAFEVTSGKEPDLTADLNYHIPWHTLAGLDMDMSAHAMLYTHCNPGDEGALMDACARAKLVVCMSYTGRNELVARGVDPVKLWVIYAATDTFAARRRNIGIVGYEQPNGRKRSHILLDLAWTMDLDSATLWLDGLPIAGEIVELEVVRAGKEAGQGVGYLDDGTMVIVNNGVELVGTGRVRVEITTVVPTSVGRLLFARVARQPESAEPSIVVSEPPSA